MGIVGCGGDRHAIALRLQLSCDIEDELAGAADGQAGDEKEDAVVVGRHLGDGPERFGRDRLETFQVKRQFAEKMPDSMGMSQCCIVGTLHQVFGDMEKARFPALALLSPLSPRLQPERNERIHVWTGTGQPKTGVTLGRIGHAVLVRGGLESEGQFLDGSFLQISFIRPEKHPCGARLFQVGIEFGLRTNLRRV